jgi:hypothetical protein
MNSISKKLMKQRWLIGCLLFFIIACGSKKQFTQLAATKTDSIQFEKKITSALDSISCYKKLVRTGDLILRTGKDFTSETMRLLSLHDKTYSHCGIASIEDDSVFVYHSIGGELNPDGRLRRDPFELFCNPYESSGFGIFRYNLSQTENKELLAVVHRLYRSKVKFDMSFILASNDRMYCSEFVYKVLNTAINHKIILPTTFINSVQFIAIDNLFLNPLCRQVKRVKFTW